MDDRKELALEELTATLDRKRKQFAEQMAQVNDLSKLERVNFQLGARVELLEEVVAGLTNCTLDEAISTLRGRVCHGAKFPSHSTNPLSNLADQCRLAAAADLMETLEQYNRSR